TQSSRFSVAARTVHTRVAVASASSAAAKNLRDPFASGVETNDDLSFDVALGHRAQRVRGAFQRHCCRDVRPKLSLGVPSGKHFHAFPELMRLTFDEITPKDADNRRTLQQRKVQRHFWNLSGRKADHEESSAPRGRSQRCLRVASTDGVEGDIDAPAAGNVADALS